MKYRTVLLKRITLLVLLSLYGIIDGKEVNIDSNLAKNVSPYGRLPRGGRTRVRINIAPIYKDYDSYYFQYRDYYSDCIPYYFHYGYPPSAFNFGLRIRSGRTYYYCPSGYYYNRSRYKDPPHRHIDRVHIRYRQ